MAKVKTVDDWRAVHDNNVIVPNKIRAALAAMLKEGPEQWDYEADFMKRAGISQTQIAQFREGFSDHIVEAPGLSGRSSRRVWFADVKVAKKVRSA